MYARCYKLEFPCHCIEERNKRKKEEKINYAFASIPVYTWNLRATKGTTDQI